MKMLIRKTIADLPLPLKNKIKKTRNWFLLNIEETKFGIAILYGKISRFFSRPKFPDVKSLGFNVHLGCGEVNNQNFINVDGFPFQHVHYVHRIDKLPMFKDRNVDLIYASHCLEHFSYNQTCEVLSEWHRVLKNGGILRLSVPDFDKLVDIYKLNENNPDIIVDMLMGGQNSKFNYHLTVLNKTNLTLALEKVGFYEIFEWLPNNDELTTFNDFSTYKRVINGYEYEISLNLQATKIYQ